MEFLRTSGKKRPAPEKSSNPESSYWRNFHSSLKTTFKAHCTSLDYNPVSPFDLAVTSGHKIHLRGGKDGSEIRAFSRFHEVAYSGKFRKDGKLLAGGDHKGIVSVSDATTKVILRSYEGHTSSACAVRWSCEGTRLFSSSDDRTVRIWDLSTGNALGVRNGHSDYVRALEPSPSQSDIFLSGGYDKALNLWDARETKCVMNMNHGSAVEAILFLPNENLIASAGGNFINIWDLKAGKALKNFSNHQKTITCLALDSTKTRILSGGLDSFVKFYSLDSFKVTSGKIFKSPVISLAVSNDGSQYSVGTSDCSLTIMKKLEKQISTERIPEGLARNTKLFNERGKTAKPDVEDTFVESAPKVITNQWDISLKKFRYQKALDDVLKNGSHLNTYAVLEELSKRRGLEIALKGRMEGELMPIMSYLAKNLNSFEFSHFLVNVALVFIEIYKHVLMRSKLCKKKFMELYTKVQQVISNQIALKKMVGSMNMMMASASSIHLKESS